MIFISIIVILCMISSNSRNSIIKILFVEGRHDNSNHGITFRMVHDGIGVGGGDLSSSRNSGIHVIVLYID